MSADNLAGKAQYDKDNLSKEELAYLFGVYLGDGCCYKNKSFTIVSGDKDVIERTSEIVKHLFKKEGRLSEIHPNNKILFRFRAYNKELFEALTSQTKNKSELPSFVLNADFKIITAFVAGLMDTDGYISTGINKYGWQRYSLGFINSADWLENFIFLLQKNGVKVGKKTLKKKYRGQDEKDCYQININLRSFTEKGFYFNCERKQELLEKYKSNVKYQSY